MRCKDLEEERAKKLFGFIGQGFDLGGIGLYRENSDS